MQACDLRGDVQNYLELAVDYGNSGLWDEVINVLLRLVKSNEKETCTYPMVYYFPRNEFEETLNLNINHIGARRQLSALK